MVIDTSAILAILFAEPEARTFATQISKESSRLVSSISVLEASMVLLSRKGPSGPVTLDLFLESAEVDIVGFDVDQAQLARQAYAKFGKGRHPAALNLGDCCTYALAKAVGEPLLCKGNDFPKTDLTLVLG